MTADPAVFAMRAIAERRALDRADPDGSAAEAVAYWEQRIEEPLPDAAEPADRLRTVTPGLGAQLLAHVADDPPQPLVIDRLDPEGQTVLYGPGGVGKGVLASSWIVALTAAGHRVAILDYENHPGEWSRRVGGLGSDTARRRVLHAAPLSASWKGKRGPIWQQADAIASLLAGWQATVVVIDSIVMACGADPTKPEAAAQYASAIELLGLPTLSIAHVTKAEDVRYPFGSVFWHNLARVTWSLEPDGEGAILTPRKHNNYARPRRFAVNTTWREGLPREVSEKPYSSGLANRIAVLLTNDPLSVGEVVAALNEGPDGARARTNSVQKALTRDSDRFAKVGKRWTLA